MCRKPVQELGDELFFRVARAICRRMRNAEQVTFGSGGLDRAADWRKDGAAEADGGSVVALWRGKPLVRDDALARLDPQHPLLLEASGPRLLLAREGRSAVWAADVSGWEPDGHAEAPRDSFSDDSTQVHPAVPDAAFTELRRVMTRLGRADAELSATARSTFAWHETHRFCPNCGSETEVAMSGWQRGCPACGRSHFPRTDPVVIMLVTHGNSVLLGRSPGWPQGMFSLLAGFVEPGETLEAAVRREVFEETGVRVGPVGYLASQPWAFPASLMCGMRAEAVSTEITVDPAEIETALWVTREDLADVFAGQHPEIKPARAGAIAHFLMENWLADRLE